MIQVAYKAFFHAQKVADGLSAWSNPELIEANFY